MRLRPFHQAEQRAYNTAHGIVTESWSPLGGTGGQVLGSPVTAVGSAEGHSTVMRVTDGLVERIAVTTGIRDGGWVEIVKGLAPGETVVTKAGAFVRDGDRINPVVAATN